MEPAKATVTGPTLHISMKESAIAVEEVVAIGYSTVRKEELTSSVTRVDASDFNGGVTTSPINLISGKVPGLTIRNTAGTDPNAAPEIQLRGVGSIRAGSTPLIIIDGVYSTMNDLQAINAQDIASFNVLKDASSAAIYGTRGSNGVIIVETKNAEQGRAHIDYTSYYYTERAARKLDMMSANQYLDYLTRHGQSAANNDYGFSTDWTDELLRNNFSYYQGVSFSTSGKIPRCAPRSVIAIPKDGAPHRERTADGTHQLQAGFLQPGAEHRGNGERHGHQNAIYRLQRIHAGNGIPPHGSRLRR